MTPDQSERPSVKLRRILFRKDIETEEISEETSKHKYHVLKMSFDQGQDKIIELQNLIKNDDFLQKVKIRNLQSTDATSFVRLYNRAFITAPDPFRSLSMDDFQHFDLNSTFVAVLYGQLIGFIYLTIEPLIKQEIEVGKQGVIAGLGVDPRYRRKKIAFLLAAKAAEYFTKHEVDELICEVYHTNKISYAFIKNFGMVHTGTTYL
jgi:ribosomal protein S18 acetylase RimI-like enzyme